MNSKSTIFISNFHPFVSRNIFDTGVLDLLAKESRQVVVFVMPQKFNYLKKYEKDNITVMPVDLQKCVKSKLQKRMHRIAELFLDTNTKRLHQRIYKEQSNNVIKYYFAQFFMSTFGHVNFLRFIFRKVVLLFSTPHVFDEYFRKYKPNKVVVTDPFSPYDLLLMKDAKLFPKVELVALVRSWDNFTTKDYLQVLPDRTIVQNEDMLKEAQKYHDIPTDSMSVVGVPQFEYYKKYKPISREDFCKLYGFDVSDHIIVFSPAGDKFSSTDWQICEILKQQQIKGNILPNVRFIVRLHPMNLADLSKFEPNENFVIENPGNDFETGVPKEAEMGMEEVNHLADTLYHCDLVINSVSSLIIDAAVFDKPTVTIGFDGWEKDVPFTRSVLAEQANEWLQVLLNKGLSPLAKDGKELVVYINQYLENPRLDQEKRKDFVEKHCYKLDGKSSERITDAILNKQWK